MRNFIHDDFLLQSETARVLYHDYAKDMPIIDYHCHLDPKEIAQDKRYSSITEVWLGGDHYKWRAMRTNGIDESAITGNAPDKKKFLKWAETIPALIGNPLYHWTHLELKRYFDIDLLLGPDTAEEIWEQCNSKLNQPDFTARGIIKQSHVEVICTTDDPVDTLEYHKQIKADDSFDVRVLPTFRPDRAINIEKQDFRNYVQLLSSVAKIPIHSFADLLSALQIRIAYFHKNGCRLSDHAMEPPVFAPGTEKEVNAAFKKALNGNNLTDHEIALYKTRIMLFLGKQYAEHSWVMQLHIGTQRDNNTRMLDLLGPNTGYDMMSDCIFAYPLARFMDTLDQNSLLPKTILYVINPRDNEMVATLAGCFQGDGIPGKIQFGSGWWFNDQKDGMIRQMTALANMGLLSRFVGMLTDSRSFLSYTRHEYFRRILCNLLGSWVENGEAPDDMALLGKMAQDISYYNAKRYFQL